MHTSKQDFQVPKNRQYNIAAALQHLCASICHDPPPYTVDAFAIQYNVPPTLFAADILPSFITRRWIFKAMEWAFAGSVTIAASFY